MTKTRKTVTRTKLAPETGATCNTYILLKGGYTTFCGKPAVLRTVVEDHKWGTKITEDRCEGCLRNREERELAGL